MTRISRNYLDDLRSTKAVSPARLGVDGYTEAPLRRATMGEPATFEEALNSKYSEQRKADPE